MAACLAGCGDDVHIPAARDAVVRIDTEPAGANCAAGGSAVHIGLDDNDNGVLDNSEIDETTFVCEPGALTRVADEPAGENCEVGGTAILAGPDRNGNGALDDDEIASTTYICDDVLAPLLSRFDDEPAGEHCATGGTAIGSGLDLDGNGMLDAQEVLRVDYVCDSPPDLVRIDPEPQGTNCPTGGAAVHSGADNDGDGVLGQDEITATDYVCDNVYVGDLEITQFTDMAALAELTAVTGELRTAFCGTLAEISLPALRVVGGDIHFQSCSALASVSLPALERVAGQVQIAYNPALTALDLSALRDTSGLTIRESPLSGTLDLGALFQVFGELRLQDLPITGLDLGALAITDDLHLWNLAAPSIALPNLDAVQSLYVVDSALTSLSAPRLFWVREHLVIARDPNLLSLSLPRIEMIDGNLIVREQGAMTTFALPLLDILRGNLGIWDNLALTGFSLPLLRTVGGDLSITGNDALTSVAGLAALETIMRGFIWQGNALMQDLSELAQLRRIGLGNGAPFEVGNSSLRRIGLANLREARLLEIGWLGGSNPLLETLDLPLLRETESLGLQEAPVATRLDLPQVVAIWGVLGVSGAPNMPQCRVDALLAQLAIVPPTTSISGTDPSAPCN